MKCLGNKTRLSTLTLGGLNGESVGKCIDKKKLPPEYGVSG